MNNVSRLINESRKIVIKIGSNTISGSSGKVNYALMHNIVDQINELIKMGKKVVIVSSGAGICGVAAINKWHRKGDINYKQALCAIGQVELMNAYKDLFDDYRLHVAQILLTREDFEENNRNLNIRNTLFTLVDEGVVPIINENDSVCVDEIRIGDNDTLAALTANLWGADLLILFSDIDGIYDKNPNEHPDAQLIPEVRDIEKLKKEIDISGKSDFGTGGIATKLIAVELLAEYGIPMILTNGQKEDVLRKLIDGTMTSTVFINE